MTYSTYSKERKSLQFPVMCDGYVKIPYSDSVALSENGIWANNGSFTIEMIVTPYDVNSNGWGDNTVYNKKTFPGNTNYIPNTEVYDIKMVLFHNSNITIALRNTTTDNYNQPSQYAIEFKLKIGSTTTLLISDTIIKTIPIGRNTSTSPTDYLYDKHGAYARVLANVTGASSSGNTFNINIADTANFYVGQPLYDDFNNYLGTMVAWNTSTEIEATNVINNSMSKVYTLVRQEPVYATIPHHIGISYDNVNGIMSIIYNNDIIKSGKHGVGGKFQLDGTDIYLGQNPNAGSSELKRQSQFMGEYHEISVLSLPMTKFRSLNTLTPFFRKTLLYLDFEGANLNG